MSDHLHSLTRLLEVLTSGENREARQAFASLSPEARSNYYSGYLTNLQILGLPRERIEGELSLILVIRLLWSLVPAALFRGIDPYYEDLADESLRTVVGPGVDDRQVRMLAIIFRRLRSAYLRGRSVASIDLGLSTHKELMVRQQYSCAVCLYRFPAYWLHEDFEETELSYYRETYVGHESEVVLETYYRRPVLDHIIPFFLGGDGPENWQVLCYTCNGGKGDSLSWLSRRGWLPPTRVSDVMSLTPALRYACLAAGRPAVVASNGRGDATLRLFKKDPRGLILAENLQVSYC